MINPYITILFYLLSLVKADPIEGRLSPGLLTPIWHENIGLLLEPLGVALHPRSSVIKSLNIIFPHPYPTFTQVTCGNFTPDQVGELEQKSEDFFYNMLNIFRGENERITQQMCTRMPPGYCKELHRPQSQILNNSLTKHREKRFLPLLAAGLGLGGLGLSIYNTVNEKEMSDAITSLHSNQEAIADYTNRLNAFQGKVIALERSTFLKIEDVVKQWERQFWIKDCHDRRQEMFLRTEEHLDFMHGKYERIIHAIFRGDLTDEILSPTELRKSFLLDGDLKDTLYTNDLSLMYKLASTIPVKYDATINSVSMLIIIPVVTEDDIAPTYLTTNYGWYHGSNQFKVQIDSIIGLFPHLQGMMPLGIQENNCHRKNGLWICDTISSISSSHTRCMLGIFYSSQINKPDCTILTKISQAEAILAKTTFGLVLKGYPEVKLIESVTSRRVGVYQKILLDPNKVTFFSYSDFESIQVGEEIITSPPKTPIIHRVDTLMNLTSWNNTGYIHLSKSNWDSLHALEQEYNKLQDQRPRDLTLHDVIIRSPTGWLFWGLIILFVLCLIGIVFLVYRKRSNRLQGSYQSMPLDKGNRTATELSPIPKPRAF